MDTSGCGVPCESGTTRECSCGCNGSSGRQSCDAEGEWTSCSCFDFPDIPDAHIDAPFDAQVDADADLDAATDGSADAFRPWPGLRDAARDSDEPDGISWIPDPVDPPDPPMYADALRLTVTSASAPTTNPAGRPWDVDGAPDLRVDIETRAGVVLQSTVAPDSFEATFTDDASVRVAPTEPLRFVLRDVDELTPTGARSEVVLECTPRVTEEIRAAGGALRCRDGESTIEVEAEALFR